ncbi:MAG: thioesterase family protein [Polyangiaceae bacterium]
MTPREEAATPRVSATHRERIVVGTEAIDELGHASNIAWVKWVQDAAKAHSARAGFDYARYVELGAVFVVRRHELDYLGSALEGDELDVETYVESWGAASSVRRTVVTRARDGHVMLRACTLWALVAIATGRPRRIPDVLRDAFAKA